jgi:hypothetical protein
MKILSWIGLIWMALLSLLNILVVIAGTDYSIRAVYLIKMFMSIILFYFFIVYIKQDKHNG